MKGLAKILEERVYNFEEYPYTVLGAEIKDNIYAYLMFLISGYLK